ncbi:MAG: hypothetical protein ACKOYN_00160 [Planctomycetota bacterium]
MRRPTSMHAAKIAVAACMLAMLPVVAVRGEGGAPPPPSDGSTGSPVRISLLRVFHATVYPRYLVWLDQSPAMVDSAGTFQLFLVLQGYSPELQMRYMQIYTALFTPNEAA